MKLYHYLPFLLLLGLFSLMNPHQVIAQSGVPSDSVDIEVVKKDSTFIQHIDSLLNLRLSKIDSLARSLKEKTESAADSISSAAAGDTEEAIAHLKEVISWQKVVVIVILFILTYYFTVFIGKVLDNFAERISKYRLKIKRMVPIIRVLAWTLAIYMAIAGIIQPPYATVITVLASVGIAVGLASQDVLKNLFGGIMLILDRPFQVGDKITFNEHYGEVLQIGLRSSRIVTPGDSVVTIPNGELIKTAVSNSNSGALDCQVITEIFLPAETPISEVKEIAYKAVVSSRYVFLKKPISILTLNEMRERRFILKLKVKAYVLDIRYEFPFQSDITELILSELRKKGYIKNEFQLED